MLVLKPLSLASSVTKSTRYFCHARWQGRRRCLRCRHRGLYRLSNRRFRCKRCQLTFGDFTGTYLGTLRMPLNEVVHLLYLFVLGVPAYRCRRYLTVSLKTAHRTFTVFREAIYEGFWSFAKNWLYQYRGVPQQHFHLYLKELEFRFNHRNDDLFDLIASLLVNLVPDVT